MSEPRVTDRSSAEVADATVRLTGRIVPCPALTGLQRTAMFDLMTRHFRGVDQETFAQDLREKSWVILIEDGSGGLQGFSTLIVYETRAQEGPVTVVYSGDTIVNRTAWGSPVLLRTWIESVVRLRRRHPRGDLYWLLLTSGFRTYRLLPVFWRAFYPRHDESAPPQTKSLLDALARERFGERYDAGAGVVRFPRPQVLREDLLQVAEGRQSDPHVAFFLIRNPGYVRGDELVCLTRIAQENLTAAGRRVVGDRARELGS